MAWRFAEVKLNWSTMVVDPAKVRASARKFPGVVMFPTSHDLTPAILPDCLKTLTNMLSHGSNVLIVSKPHLEVIQTLCAQLAPYKEQILFRFTIGSLLDPTIQLWEPGAPLPQERIEALKHAYKLGFHTSVSMEPMLGDVVEMRRLVRTVYPFVSDSIWLGKMNGIVITKGLPPPLAVRIVAAKNFLKAAHSDQNILSLVSVLSVFPKIQWKDSIQKVIAAAAPRPMPTANAASGIAVTVPAANGQKAKDPKRIAAAQKAWVTIRAKRAAAALKATGTTSNAVPKTPEKP